MATLEDMGKPKAAQAVKRKITLTMVVTYDDVESLMTAHAELKDKACEYGTVVAMRAEGVPPVFDLLG